MRSPAEFPISLVLFTVVLGIVPCKAQVDQGSIEGVVVDQSGARIPAARLTATNISSNAQYSVESDREGLYRFLLLPVGRYDLEITANGFSVLHRNGIQVGVGAQVDLNVALGVSVQPENLTVTDDAPIIEASRTPVSFNVDKDSVANLPVNGRNFMDFVLLTPGVARDVRTGELSFGGQRGVLNSLTVDGFDNNNTFFGQTTGGAGTGRAPYQFSQDSVQEFQVNKNSYSAEMGRASAVVNVVTKSGSNQFHGTGFWFYRDRGLTAFDPVLKLEDAINNTNSRKPAYHLNQFGGDVGGPISRDHLFFFFAYDGQRNAQFNDVALNLPPISDPTLFQESAIAYLTDHAERWNRGLNQDTFLLKVDWKISSRHSLSARWNKQDFDGAGIEIGGPIISFEDSGTSIVNTNTVGVSLTSALSPELVNIARFGYLVDDELGRPNSDLPRAIVGEQGQTLLILGRAPFDPRETLIHRKEIADTLLCSRGRHSWKLGTNLIFDDILNFFPGNFSGAYFFHSLENFGRSLAGQPLITTSPGAPGDTFTQSFAGPETSGATTKPNILEASWFAEDEWRLQKNVVVSLGLRWDVQSLAKPSVSNPSALAIGVRTGQLDTDWNNFGPRLGLAWSPFKNSRTVVRAGYGIFYGRTPSILVSTAQSSNGVNVSTKIFSDSSIPFYPNSLCGPPVEFPNCPPPDTGLATPSSIYVFAPAYEEPIVQQANVNIEHALTSNLSVNAGWEMVKGNHLERTRDINLGTPSPAAVTISTTGEIVNYLRYPSARPFSDFARISEFKSDAHSVYHALFIHVRKRMSHQFEGSVSYTYSHVIDDAPDINAVVPFGPDDDSLLVYDPKNPRIDRSSGLDDQRHLFVLSGIWQLHYANNLKPVATAILGGWQLSLILSASSGKPFTGLIAADLNNDSNQFTDRLPAQGRNGFNLPATWTLDPRLSKSWNIKERIRMEFMAEAFNVFNHFNVPAVNNAQFQLSGNQLVPQSTFGLPTSPGTGSNYPYVSSQNLNGARILQLGARIGF